MIQIELDTKKSVLPNQNMQFHSFAKVQKSFRV